MNDNPPWDDQNDPDYNVSGSVIRKQFTKHAKLIEHFQTRWRKEYLTALREFQRISGHNEQTIKVGDVVMVHDDGPRIHWQLAIVNSLIKGNHGLVHAANMQTSNSITSRPITRLYPLELSFNYEPNSTDLETDSDGNNTSKRNAQNEEMISNIHPKRAAAKRAEAQLLEWTERLRCLPEDIKN